MPPASNPFREASLHPASQSPSPRPPGTADVAKKKKTGKNAPRKDNEVAKTEEATLIDDIQYPPTMSQQQPESSVQQPFAVRAPSNQFDSPVLDALGAFSHEPDVKSRTGTWADSVPFGKSPPSDHPPESTATDGSPPAFAPTGEQNPPRTTPHSPVPPQRKPRPSSYAPGYSPSISSRHQSGERQKRYSMSPQYANQPPPPHLPQAHFYGAPDIDLGIPDPASRAVPELGYSFCALDTLPHPLPKSAKFGGKVVVIGYDGSLEVFALDTDQKRAIGGLDGLNGRVIDAKILTWASGKDPFAALRPLVAVTIHGPLVRTGENSEDSSGSDNVETVLGAPSKYDTPHKAEEPPQMQTRVQVYSLRTQELIATLFATKPSPVLENFLSLPPSAPPPIGNLKLHISGNFVILASGTSGEVFIYGAVPLSSSGAFQCFGKTWTAIQPKEARRQSNSSSSTDPDDSNSEMGRGSDTPILSISGRWLATVSPSPTRVSLHGTIPSALTQRKPYGLDAYSPPSRPSVTCAVDPGAGESLLNKVARGVTQELFRGARWIGDQGMQSWNNYWNKDSQGPPTAPPLRRPQPADTHPSPSLLPPTHAHDNQSAVANEPDLVSIFDLKQLEESHDLRSSSPAPIATFQPPNGCSFLSLSSTGIMLLTASRKGDVQYIWDLMQIRHCRARAFLSEDASSMVAVANPPAAHVRLVSRYARLTTSSIVDIIWTAPTGDQIAIITKKGTVHVYSLPSSAFQWPPLRRLSASPPPAPSGESPPGEETAAETSVGNPFSSAMKLVGGKTQPILAAVRGRTPSVGAAFAGAGGLAFASNAGVRGGKAVAAGLSKSVGAATNTLRHAGENRLHLTNFSRDPAVSRVAWLGDETCPLLGIIDGGFVKVYHIRPSSSSNTNQPVIGPKTMETQLPAHAQLHCGPQQPIVHNTNSNVTGFWSVPSTVAGPSSTAKLKTLPLSQAEIETNAPYQPFHTDRRVNLKIYPADYADETSTPAPWAFGNDIPATKIRQSSPSTQSDGEDDNSGVPQQQTAGEMENHVSLGSGAGNVEHIVITTRRKKKKAAAMGSGPGGATAGDEDGFFEDDCEVLDFAQDRV